MKRALILCVVACASINTVKADCCISSGTITTQFVPYCGNTCWQIEQIKPMSYCDSNDKTPIESLKCKLEYWQKEEETRAKAFKEAEKQLDAAKERVTAFKHALEQTK